MDDSIIFAKAILQRIHIKLTNKFFILIYNKIFIFVNKNKNSKYLHFLFKSIVLLKLKMPDVQLFISESFCATLNKLNNRIECNIF